MRKHPERVAWMVLLASFATFCFLAVTIPLAIRWYIINATNTHEATLEVISGTVLVEEIGRGAPLGVMANMAVPERRRIITDGTSRAILTLFDNSTLTLFPETEITLVRMRSPRFGLSPKPNTLVVEEIKGRIRVGVAPPVNRPVRFEVRSPQMTARLKEGSYSIEVLNDVAQVAVRDGEALVEAEGETVTLALRERAMAEAGRKPMGPLAAARDLIINGDFKYPLAKGWRSYNEQGGDGGDIDGQVRMASDGARQAVRFLRTGGEGNHCETGIEQEINMEVSDFVSLELHADVKLNYHNLSGGGYQSSEYPIIIRLNYEDAYGSVAHWTHGFYYQNEDGLPTQNGELIPRFVWYPYETENLFEILTPRPFYINSIQIYASGWDYDSLVYGISLVVE